MYLTTIFSKSSTRDTQSLLLPVLRLSSHRRITSYSSIKFYLGLSLHSHISMSQNTQTFRKLFSNLNAATQATITQRYKALNLLY